jgi:NAD(P)H dehydrogenase (quinone)
MPTPPPRSLAEEHRATEQVVTASGIPFVLLRNGWSLENHTSQLPIYLQQGGSSQDIAYQDVGVDVYTEILVSAGLPEPLARTVADSDRAVAAGELYVDTGDLSRLIGRPTTDPSTAIASALV